MHGLTGGSWKRSHDHRASFLPYSICAERDWKAFLAPALPHRSQLPDMRPVVHIPRRPSSERHRPPQKPSVQGSLDLRCPVDVHRRVRRLRLGSSPGTRGSARKWVRDR
jgi:hypothetical protein